MPLNINFQQILLHMFNFVLLFGITYFLLYSPVKKFIEGRKKYYEDMDKSAQENLEAAQSAKAQYEAKLSDAEKEAEAKKTEILDEAGKQREAIINDAKKEADGIIEASKKRAENEKELSVAHAKQEIEEYVTKAAREIVSGIDPVDSFLEAAKKDS